MAGKCTPIALLKENLEYHLKGNDVTIYHQKFE